MTEIIDQLQCEDGCTAIICESSLMILERISIPNEQQQAEADSAYARMKHGRD